MLNTILLNLLEAKVTLYAPAPGGALGPALWSGQQAERLTVAERWLTVETRPTGGRYPAQHPLVPQYDISIERVWALPVANLAGFMPGASTYVLDVLWTEEETGQWHRRTFYGVTINSRSFAPQSIESEFVDGQSFQSQYFTVATGSAATPVPVPPAIAWRVVWRSAADGDLALYNFTDAGYTEAVPGNAATRAVIAADGGSIRFAGSSVDVLTATADGVTVAALHDAAADALPCLRFYAGPALLATLTAGGLWARNLRDGAVPGDGFKFKAGDVVAGAINAAAAAALAWDAEA